MGEDWSSDKSEARRLAILASYPLDRVDISDQLDRLAELAAKLCDTPIGLVSLIEANRQRFVGKVGLAISETPREFAFCDIARLSENGMIVPDAREDPRFATNPLVTGGLGIRLYASQPLRSLEGAPLGTICVIDTKPRAKLSSEQVNGLRTLADAAMALLERWRLDSSSRAQAKQSQSAIHDLEQRFQVLADAMPQMVWSSLPSGQSDYFNRLWCDYTGAPPAASYGERWMRFLHPDDTASVSLAWSEAVATGGVYEVEYRLRSVDGSYRWMLARGIPMRDQQGAVSRWLGTCTDIQEQKAVAEQQDLLTRELSHRIKNIFAVISGLISLSVRRHPELKEVGSDLQHRVLALGRAHDFVRPHAQEAPIYQSHNSLAAMLASVLGPYQARDETRITIIGADTRIDDRSATPLALFFHELATNAAKYGALSAAEGEVSILIDSSDAQAISLSWSERNGPPVPETFARGFGSHLIEMSVVRQLGGTLEYQWHQDGLRVVAQIPTNMMAR